MNRPVRPSAPTKLSKDYTKLGEVAIDADGMELARQSKILTELSRIAAGFMKLWKTTEVAKFSFDFSNKIDIGGRSYQEDAVHVETFEDHDCTLCVLADGMGGHAAGDVASKIVIENVLDHMRDTVTKNMTAEDICAALRQATDKANEKLQQHSNRNSQTKGMGSTLVAAVFYKKSLHWVSIGDSPLYLMRAGKLHQINQDHSMAPQIDQMAKVGILTLEEAKDHPDRNNLTSALMGTPPEKVDTRMVPFDLQLGDIFIISSDGLQFLSDRKIEKVANKYRKSSADVIANTLMKNVLKLENPNQDNISIAVVRVAK